MTAGSSSSQCLKASAVASAWPLPFQSSRFGISISGSSGPGSGCGRRHRRRGGGRSRGGLLGAAIAAGDDEGQHRGQRHQCGGTRSSSHTPPPPCVVRATVAAGASAPRLREGPFSRAARGLRPARCGPRRCGTMRHRAEGIGCRASAPSPEQTTDGGGVRPLGDQHGRHPVPPCLRRAFREARERPICDVVDPAVGHGRHRHLGGHTPPGHPDPGAHCRDPVPQSEGDAAAAAGAPDEAVPGPSGELLPSPRSPPGAASP